MVATCARPAALLPGLFSSPHPPFRHKQSGRAQTLVGGGSDTSAPHLYDQVNESRFHASAGDGLYRNPAYGLGQAAAPPRGSWQQPKTGADGLQDNPAYVPAQPEVTYYSSIPGAPSSAEAVVNNPAYGHGAGARRLPQTNAWGQEDSPAYEGMRALSGSSHT